MDIGALLVWLFIGAVAGWLAGLLMKGRGFGLLGNIVVGILGSVVAGLLLPRIGFAIGGGLVGDIVNALIGACLLLFVISLVKKA